MTWDKYADLWLKRNFGNSGGITEWQAAKYVAAIATYFFANATERKRLILEAEAKAMRHAPS